MLNLNPRSLPGSGELTLEELVEGARKDGTKV